MQGGDIHKLIAIFYASLERLDARLDLAAIERFAVIVHKAMTIQTRNYHTLEHVFEFVEPSDPIRTLAALYHDLVYYQVDRGFLPEIEAIISPYILEQDGQIFLREQVSADDRPLNIALTIFDFKPGNELSTLAGLNEFLSALVLNKQLGDFIREADWLKMVVCIEATIPFRGGDYFYSLEERVRNACEKYGISLTQNELDESIKRAVIFANKDVESFSEKDVEKFLESTWKLLPETHAALRSRDLYSIREYRQALYRTEAFLRSLNPEHVFHSYRDIPSQEASQRLAERARMNLAVACEYLEIKLLTQAVLEALADVTGGDAPLSLFMGDLPKDGERTLRLEDLLPRWPDPPWMEADSVMYRLLRMGRMGDANFDLNTAPLSLFICKNLKSLEQKRLSNLAKEMFNGHLSAQDFLEQFDQSIVSAVAGAIAAMVLTRREALLRYTGLDLTNQIS